MDSFLYLFDDYIWYLRTVNTRPSFSPTSPCADAPALLRGAGHVSAVYWRRGRSHPAPTSMTPSGRRSTPPGAPILSIAPSFTRNRSQSAPPRRHCWPTLRRSPPAVSTGHSPRQGHRCVRHRHGKPLRTLDRGDSPPRNRNSSPEFARPRRSAPPYRNPPFLALFRLFLSALGS